MAIYEGPASTGEELAGSAGASDIPALTPERAQQELAKLSAIITANESLHFLEPRVRRCQDSATLDTTMLLSFYRLISQALSEELGGQKQQLNEAQTALVQAKQSSSQQQMLAAFEEASQAVQMVTRSGETSASVGGTPTSVAAAGAPGNEALALKLEQAEKQSERLLQDMQNIRNRSKIDVDVKVFKELEKFCHSLIPALDAFHQAIPTLKTTSDIGSVVTGVTMIHDQLMESLAKAGLSKLKVIGEPFDPRYHEAIGEVESNDVPDEHVYDELQPGYVLGERMIRAAMVRLARNSGGGAPPSSTPPVTEEVKRPQTEILPPPATVATPTAPPPTAAPQAIPSAELTSSIQGGEAPSDTGSPPHEETSLGDPNP